MRMHHASREARQLALLWGAAAAAAVVLRPFWLQLALLGLPPCPLRAATGIPCPTCGTTRATVALLHGEVGIAFSLNPLATLAGMVFVLGGILAVAWVWVKAPLPQLPSSLSLGRALASGLVLALLANWAWLLAHR